MYQRISVSLLSRLIAAVFGLSSLNTWHAAIAQGDQAGSPEPAAVMVVAAEMQKEVELLRGWQFKHPVDVGVYTEQQMRDFVEEPFRENGEEREISPEREAAVKMIGLVPRDVSLVESSKRMFGSLAPPGIYNHKTGELRVLERKDGNYGGLEVRITLAHELTHALDDQHFGFDGMLRRADDSSDVENVWGAIVEGSGVTLQERFRQRAKESGSFSQGEFLEFMMSGMKQMQAILDSPPYMATFFARFPTGVQFLQYGNHVEEGDESGQPGGPGSLSCVGPSLIKAAANPPSSTEQILHPAKYWKDDERDEPVVVGDKDMDKLFESAELRVIHKDTFGELLCAVLTSPMGKRINPMGMPLPGYWTTEAASGWGGDRFYLLTLAANGETLPAYRYGVWVTLWDTSADRDEFVEAYSRYRDVASGSLAKFGRRDAIFFFGFEATWQAKLEAIMRAKPPGLDRSGKVQQF